MKALLLLVSMCLGQTPIVDWDMKHVTNNILTDLMGQQNGNVYGAIPSDSGLVFNGLDSIVTTAGCMSCSQYNQFTIVARIYPSMFWGAGQRILSNGQTGTNGFMLSLTKDSPIFPPSDTGGFQIMFQTIDRNYNLINKRNVIHDHVWYDIVITCDSDSTCFYLNQNRIGSMKNTLAPEFGTTMKMFIGKTTQISQAGFIGTIARLTVYSDVLTPQQIPSDMESYVKYTVNNVVVQPNPFTSSTFIRAIGISNIYTIDGRLIHTDKGMFTWNAPSAGQYILRNGVATKKMIVVR
jgi:hypothetical protein